MYKVFVNDHFFILTSQTVHDEGDLVIPLNEFDIESVIKHVDSGKWTRVKLFHHNKKKLLSKFKKKIPVVVAGGGLVRNTKGKVLFIFRDSKWDLPKGKAEKGERIEETALRETQEETGVDGLEIVNALGITYHLFKRNGKIKLKETHWFNMKTQFTGTLIPQLDEGVTKVKWKGEKKTKKALKKSYANIRDLFLKIHKNI